MPTKINLHHHLIVKIGFTLFFAWIIFRQIHLSQLLTNLTTATPLPLLYFLIHFPLAVWISTHRWQIILRHFHFKLPFSQLFRSYFLASFYSQFLPTDIAGDLYKSLSLARHHRLSRKLLFVTTLLDRLSGLVILLLIPFFCSWLLFPFLPRISLSPVYLLIFVFAFLLVAFFSRSAFIPIISSTITKLKPHLLLLFKPNLLFWSLLFLLQNLIAYYLVFLSLGINLPFHYLLLFIPLIQLTNLIPLTPSAFGTKEAIGLFLFDLIGVSSEITLAAFLLLRALLLITSTLGAAALHFHPIKSS